MTAAATPRQRCYRCMRPSDHCICDTLPTVPTRTRVVVIQHPKERSHPFGTAKLLGLSLPNSQVHTVYGGLSRSLHCPLELPSDTVLLYPHADAIELSDLDAAAPPSTLVVLDGTWAHSRRLYRENPWLQGLRHVRIAPSEPSRYRIRREPSPECLSTVEATVCALRALEPETKGLDSLIAAFDQMIDRQIDHASTHERVVRRRRPRLRPSRRLSPVLDDPNLVIVYAESSLPGGDVRAQRELVQLVGARLDGSGLFEILIRPGGTPPTGPHLAHMGIRLQDVMGGTPLTDAPELFEQLAGKGPFAAWTQSSFEWAEAVLPKQAERTVLKKNYCNVRNRGAGLIDDLVRREGLTAPVVSCRGRAAGRLANALAVTRWLRQQRGQPCT